MWAKKLQHAVTLHQQGELIKAQKIYADILKIQPKNYDCLHLLGVIALQNQDYSKAVELIGSAVRIFSKNPGFYLNLSIAFHQLGQMNEAILNSCQAIQLQPDYAEAHCNLGNIYLAQGKVNEAIESYQKAIAIHPHYAEAHSNLGDALTKQHRLEEAIASCNQAIMLDPCCAQAYSNLGNALQELFQFQAALPHYERAVSLNPNFVDAYYNYGLALRELNQLSASIRAYNHALALNSDHSRARINRSLALLLAGQFKTGWQEYEWRWKDDVSGLKPRALSGELWLGESSLEGKTILLWHEQGQGDIIHFCRYVAIVANLGARVILEVPASMLRLMASLKGVDALIESGQVLPPFDFHCPLMSLPLACQTFSEADIPASIPYLVPPAQVLAHWSQRVNAWEEAQVVRPLKVGIVWAGGQRKGDAAANRIDAQRSLSFEQFATLSDVEHVQFFSLQKDVPAEQVQTLSSGLWQGASVVDWTADLHDWVDTAGLIANLDLIIGCDTSTPHLAAAMGKPTWVLSRLNGCWRWLLDRDDSPWYPTLRLYRQTTHGDWFTVLQKVRNDLKNMALKRKACPM